MKVGILTWYDVLNYGSAFQAYALQEAIKDMGNEVEILRHDRMLPDYYGNSLSQKSLTGLMKWIRNQSPGRRRYRLQTKKKYESFCSFREDCLNIGAHYSKTDADYVLIGSDQIFDVNRFYYPFQFGKGVSSPSISTYAPCFGETTIDTLRQSENYSEIVSSLKKLKVVNARDLNTRQILECVLEKDVPEVLDPTLLYGFEKEKKTWNKRLVKEKYCLVYTWGGYTTSDDFSSQCIRFARENGMKLVSVGEYRRWCDIQFAAASPVEFFELFMYTDMVLTNMFHGTCFSILMEKPFYSFVMPHNENKVGGLLKTLYLDTQILYSPSELHMGVPAIHYGVINEHLYCKRQQSLECLENAIEGLQDGNQQ